MFRLLGLLTLRIWLAVVEMVQAFPAYETRECEQ